MNRSCFCFLIWIFSSTRRYFSFNFSIIFSCICLWMNSFSFLSISFNFYCSWDKIYLCSFIFCSPQGCWAKNKKRKLINLRKVNAAASSDSPMKAPRWWWAPLIFFRGPASAKSEERVPTFCISFHIFDFFESLRIFSSVSSRRDLQFLIFLWERLICHLRWGGKISFKSLFIFMLIIFIFFVVESHSYHQPNDKRSNRQEKDQINIWRK